MKYHLGTQLSVTCSISGAAPYGPGARFSTFPSSSVCGMIASMHCAWPRVCRCGWNAVTTAGSVSSV